MLVTGCTGDGEQPGATDVPWPSVGGGDAEQHFGAPVQISRATVARLGIAWSAELPDARGQEATPVIVGRTLYLGLPWSKVAAFDAVTGKQLWLYDPQVPRSRLARTCCDAVNRGVAAQGGSVFVGTIDGRLISLDATRGTVRWSVQTVDPASHQTITGAPRLTRDLVVIGNGGADQGARGYVSAYDRRSGALRWRFYTVPNPTGARDGAASDDILATAGASWSKDGLWRQTGGGGTVYDSIVYDPELDRVYIGVGNGSPWNQQLRSPGKGDNLFLSSIVALDARTGKYLWHYQETPGESWDFTATQPIMLADLTMNGRRRAVLMHAPKNGFFFVLDCRTGKPLSIAPYVKGINWASGYDARTHRPIEAPGARYATTMKPFNGVPGAIGAHNWQPMAFDAASGLVYVPAMNTATLYTPARDGRDMRISPIGFNTGTATSYGPLPRNADAIRAIGAATTGELVAFDPARGRVAWRVAQPLPWNGGVLATAGGLLFQGTAQGRFEARDTRNGRLLWSMAAGSGVLAAPSTYVIGGVQYVAFTTGKGGAWGVTAGVASGSYGDLANIARLIVLKLDGAAQLPASAAAAPSSFSVSVADPKAIPAGGWLYQRYCLACHGVGAVGGGVNPDLRRSGALRDAAAWRAIVIDGALSESGMVSFAPVMSRSEAETIRAYVAEEARAARTAETNDRTPK